MLKLLISTANPPIQLACLFSVCLLMVGCFHPANDDWMEFKVFCGMSQSDETISEAEWQKFCDEYVSVEFPDGYTSLCATGYWKQSDATMREDTRILLILAPSHAKEKIRRIARQYKRIFHQEAVLITTSPADAEFVDATFEDEQLKAPEDGIFVPAETESEKTGE